jgi:transmembrane sensor
MEVRTTGKQRLMMKGPSKPGTNMESRERAERDATRWIAQRETGPWDQRNAAEFEAWLAGSVSHRAAYYRLNAAWQEAGRLKALNAGAGGASATVAGANKRSPTALERLRPFAWAASLLLAVGAALFVSRDALFQLNRYSTVVGGLEAVPMSDGSRITLNTDSQLRISLSERERRIDLERGEAFFEVARDPNRPFVVQAGNQRVIAVGTQFSVRREGDDVRVVVTEGTVRMEPDGAGEGVRVTAAGAEAKPGIADVLLLAAGSVARAEHDAVLVQKKSIAEIEQSLSWRSGLLTFRDTPLANAVAEFNRYNTRKIVIEDPSIAAIEVGGVFRSTNLDPFVHLIEEAFPIRVSEEGDRIVLSARN